MRQNDETCVEWAAAATQKGAYCALVFSSMSHAIQYSILLAQKWLLGNGDG